jgi:hypothetical protein
MWIINRDIKLQALTERVHEVNHHPHPRAALFHANFMIELKRISLQKCDPDMKSDT